jgi:hypothetical protein
MLPTEKINQITIELLTGKEQAEPDDDEAAKFRADLKVELDELPEGTIVRLPNE